MNKYGTSDECKSDKVVIQDPYRLPGPPGKPKVLERTKGSMLVSWTPPLDNGGSPITGYWLEKREEGGAYWSRVSRAPITKVGFKGLEFNVPRLIEGVKYQFRAMAINAVGIGPPSEPSDPAVAGDPICKYTSMSGICQGQSHYMHNSAFRFLVFFYAKLLHLLKLKVSYLDDQKYICICVYIHTLHMAIYVHIHTHTYIHTQT